MKKWHSKHVFGTFEVQNNRSHRKILCTYLEKQNGGERAKPQCFYALSVCHLQLYIPQ